MISKILQKNEAEIKNTEGNKRYSIKYSNTELKEFPKKKE
jgi:hypothetical protein